MHQIKYDRTFKTEMIKDLSKFETYCFSESLYERQYIEFNAYVASPTKSSFEPESLSISLILSSETSTETLNTNVSFHSGSLPLPVSTQVF